ncbi:PREDICTED: uncharacterized protein LOC104608394 isoform X2 [Nelumbo nucifera]|uniref:Uncharacterized protein LOC104608394 isoform X2 n=1 Tax=Nelumbo nucifera TaxID=4432 RepID=A0A1U8B8N4_NELNU|nr:PREDICTED: uncharacterized protein LOC104608394 isoform X2 [Nelumbo nucifera]
MQISSVAPFSHHNCIRCTTRHSNQFAVAPSLSPTTTTRAGSGLLVFSSKSNHGIGIGSEKCLTTSSTSSTKNRFLEEVYSASYSTNVATSTNADGKRSRRSQTQKGEQEENDHKPGTSSRSNSGVSTNMWWQNFKANLGQRFNLEGIVSSSAVVARDQHLAIPHLTVPDISWIDWAELQRRGFKGVVFDKDNTLTAPYSSAIWPPLVPSLRLCKSVFGDNVAIFSNSAGLYQYDRDGSKARTLEESIGIHVIRHGKKKPAGTAEDIQKYLGCATSLTVMVGDRHFTDIVYGNRNGFLTILTEPLTLAEEPFIVKQVRKLEAFLVKNWCQRGFKPINHSLLPEATQCIKDPPSL